MRKALVGVVLAAALASGRLTLFDQLWSLLSPDWSDSGCRMDPNGCAAPQGDEGLGMDPDGRPAPQANAGLGMAPNG